MISKIAVYPVVHHIAHVQLVLVQRVRMTIHHKLLLTLLLLILLLVFVEIKKFGHIAGVNMA